MQQFKMDTVSLLANYKSIVHASFTFCNISGMIWLISCLIRCLRSSILFVLRHEIRQITPEMLKNVRDAGYYRFSICQQTNGGHFEHFLH
jgi:hypothetical protein